LENVQLGGASKSGITLKMPGLQAGGGGGGKAGGRPRIGMQDKQFDFTETAQIRMRHLPPKLDEKGRKIPYTADEMAKLKGPGSPGYEASASDLHAGQYVTVYFVKVRGAKGEEANHLYVSKVVIEAEPPMPAANQQPPKK
jgi:hypothetical protein